MKSKRKFSGNINCLTVLIPVLDQYKVKPFYFRHRHLEVNQSKVQSFRWSKLSLSIIYLKNDQIRKWNKFSREKRNGSIRSNFYYFRKLAKIRKSHIKILKLFYHLYFVFNQNLDGTSDAIKMFIRELLFRELKHKLPASFTPCLEYIADKKFLKNVGNVLRRRSKLRV